MLQSINKVQEVYSSETVDEGLSKILASMPATLKFEILHYAEYLLQKNAEKDILITEKDSDSSQQQQIHDDFEETEAKYGYGSLAGKITMADDFDEPLEDLQEYM